MCSITNLLIFNLNKTELITNCNKRKGTLFAKNFGLLNFRNL